MYWGKKIREAQWCGIQGRSNGGYLQGSVISKAQEVVEVPGIPPGKVAWHFDGRQLVLLDSSHAPVRPFTSSQRSSWNSLIGRHFGERSSSQKPTLDRRLNIWGVMSWDVKDAFLYDCCILSDAGILEFRQVTGAKRKTPQPWLYMYTKKKVP